MASRLIHTAVPQFYFYQQFFDLPSSIRWLKYHSFGHIWTGTSKTTCKCLRTYFQPCTLQERQAAREAGDGEGEPTVNAEDAGNAGLPHGEATAQAQAAGDGPTGNAGLPHGEATAQAQAAGDGPTGGNQLVVPPPAQPQLPGDLPGSAGNQVKRYPCPAQYRSQMLEIWSGTGTECESGRASTFGCSAF
jgi:hypothetical protein